MKPSNRPQSSVSRAALTYLAQSIKRARVERRMTAADVATRAGISRSLLQRIEKGDPSCAIGSVFEVASIVGVTLFDTDARGLQSAIAANNAVLTLLPKAVRTKRAEVDDDF